MIKILLVLAFSCLGSVESQPITSVQSCDKFDYVFNSWRNGRAGFLALPASKSDGNATIVITMNMKVKDLKFSGMELESEQNHTKFFYKLNSWNIPVDGSFGVSYVLKSMDEFDGANWQSIAFGNFSCENVFFPPTQPPLPTFAPSQHFDECTNFVTEQVNWISGWNGQIALPNQGKEMITIGLSGMARSMKLYGDAIKTNIDVYSFQSFRDEMTSEVNYGFTIEFDAKKVEIKFIEYGSFSCGDVPVSGF